jgi:site-specific recombinase XerD
MFFHFKGRRVVVSTGEKVPIQYWDQKAARVNPTPKFKHGTYVNARINLFRARTEQLWQEYRGKGILPTAAEFKKQLLQRLDEIHEEAPSLIPFIKEEIERRRAANANKGSLQIYWNLIYVLTGERSPYSKREKSKSGMVSYQERYGGRLDFSDLDENFVSRFKAHFFAQGYSDSYVYKQLSTLKMFANVADENNYFKGCPLLRIKIGKHVEKRSRDAVYLDRDEMEVLFKMELNERLSRVRDLLLLGCLTGQRFSDFTQINPANIVGKEGEKYIKLRQQKTDAEVWLPIEDPMLITILERNGWRAPKTMSNQKLNEAVKELCALAGFDEEVEITKYVGGKKVKVLAKKYELVSTHTGRRSFASNAIKDGMDEQAVMIYTGHTSMASFKKYICVTKEELAKTHRKRFFFTRKRLKKVE